MVLWLIHSFIYEWEWFIPFIHGSGLKQEWKLHCNGAGREQKASQEASTLARKEKKQNTVLTGSWTEAWSGPCTTGVSDPRPWSSRQEQMGPQEHPRKVGRGAGLGRSGPHGTGGQGGGGLGLPLVQ